MKGISDIIILGGVVAAGYLLLQSGSGGGGSLPQYIQTIPRSFSPEVKETPPAPTIIQLPSENVTFPTPKLPSVSSVLPPMPKAISQPQPIANTSKKTIKTTTGSKEVVNYGVSKTGGMATTTELKKQKKKLESTPMVEYFERMGHGGKVIVSSKKTTATTTTTKKKELNIPSMWNPQASFYEQIGGMTGGSSSIVRTTPKKSTAKTVSHRSRASFVRSFGW